MYSLIIKQCWDAPFHGCLWFAEQYIHLIACHCFLNGTAMVHSTQGKNNTQAYISLKIAIYICHFLSCYFPCGWFYFFNFNTVLCPSCMFPEFILTQWKFSSGIYSHFIIGDRTACPAASRQFPFFNVGFCCLSCLSIYMSPWSYRVLASYK